MHCLVKIVIPSVQSRPHTAACPRPGWRVRTGRGAAAGGLQHTHTTRTRQDRGRWQKKGTLSIKIFINEFFQMRNKCVRLVDVNKVRSLHLAALELRIAFVNLQYLPDQLVLVVRAVRTPCGLKQQMPYYLHLFIFFSSTFDFHHHLHQSLKLGTEHFW